MIKKLIIFIPSVEGGGVEKNLFLISDYLAKNLYKTALISANTNIKSLLNKKIEFICPKSNFWNNKGRRLKYFLCLYFLIKEIINNKNISILTFQANVYAIFIAKLFGIKIISRSNSSPTGWSKNIIKRLIFKIILKKADKIIVNSLDFKKELKKTFNVNSICIYNPLNKKQIIKLSKVKKFDSWLKNKKDKLNIINVARFTEQKDHMTLIKAIALIKDKIPIKVLIIGRGINKKIMINEISNNNLNKIIKIISFKKNPFPYFVGADLFILTSRFEGLPNVLLEAQTLKKFIISSDCPTGPREILKSGKLGYLFKVGNAEQLSKKILLFYKNRKKLHKMINLGYNSLDRFNFNYNLEKYLKTVKFILN